MESITLQPVGVVQGSYENLKNVPLWGQDVTIIEIFPKYMPALLKMDDHSHFWILSWFDKAHRDKLSIRPERINPSLPEYGVFGIRTPARPNPIALSLVKLDKIEGNKLYVLGFDAINGTFIVDIKPYYEQDIIFSPKTPYLKPLQLQKRYDYMLKEAINHHQEDCMDLRLAIRMGLIAEEKFGKINSPEILLSVSGSLCLGDVLQGLTRARLSNPPRFSFTPSHELCKSIWSKNNQTLVIELNNTIDKIPLNDEIADDDLFTIKVY